MSYLNLCVEQVAGAIPGDSMNKKDTIVSAPSKELIGILPDSVTIGEVDKYRNLDTAKVGALMDRFDGYMKRTIFKQ